MKYTTVELAKIEKGIFYIMQNSVYIACDDVPFLSDGLVDSSGIVLISGNLCRYLTNTQLDMTYALKQLSSCIDSIIKITDSADYIISAQAMVKGKIPSFSSITSDLKSIKKDIGDHKLI